MVSFVAFSPDGKTITSASGDLTIRRWRAGDGALLQTITGDCSGGEPLVFSPDRKSIIVGRGYIYFLRASDLAQFERLDVRSGVSSIALSPDGTSLVAGGNGGISLWKLTAAPGTANGGR
jgi:WD40 repeat protein